MNSPAASLPSPDQPIGVFDSGVGGLSVLRAIRQTLPFEPILYLADQAHVPYGPRPLEEVRAFSASITRFLLDRGARLIVVACNAASAAALHSLRQEFPAIQFVGMEPAVKPAAETTHTGHVGVLATPATLRGSLYASVVERFAHGVEIHEDPCPGLVEQIEKGDLDGSKPRAILERALRPMLAAQVDTVVLGCTHYPFVAPLIQSICGPGVQVIDPAPAVARQAERLIKASDWAAPGPRPGKVRYFTSGDPGELAKILQLWLGEAAAVTPLAWDGLNLKAA